MKLLLSILILMLSSQAHAYREDQWRNLQIYAGIGATKELLNISTSNDNSKYDGWAPVAEVGFDLPFTSTFGLTLSGEYRQPDTTNSKNDTKWIEKAFITSMSGKLGVFIGPVVIGAGLGTDAIMVRQVSTTTGASQTNYQGSSNLYFSSFNVNLSQHFRLSFDAEYRAGQADAIKYTDISAGAKLYLLLP